MKAAGWPSNGLLGACTHRTTEQEPLDIQVTRRFTLLSTPEEETDMDTLTIGEIAKVVGLSPATIRYYEERGLIPRAPRNESRYRLYSDEDAGLLRFTTVG